MAAGARWQGWHALEAVSGSRGSSSSGVPHQAAFSNVAPSQLRSNIWWATEVTKAFGCHP